MLILLFGQMTRASEDEFRVNVNQSVNPMKVCFEGSVGNLLSR